MLLTKILALPTSSVPASHSISSCSSPCMQAEAAGIVMAIIIMRDGKTGGVARPAADPISVYVPSQPHRIGIALLLRKRVLLVRVGAMSTATARSCQPRWAAAAFARRRRSLQPGNASTAAGAG